MEKNENGFPIVGQPQNGCAGRQNNAEGRQLAMVYSPYNEWKLLFSPEDALVNGTLFEELYKPLDY